MTALVSPSLILTIVLVNTLAAGRTALPYHPAMSTGHELVAAALSELVGLGYPFGGKSRAKGLRLTAPDIDWTHGSGPTVSGPGEALLVALAGRPSGLTDLTGDGVPTLAERQGP